MTTPSGPLNLTSAWLGRWPRPAWSRLPAVSRGVSLVAPACSILAAHGHVIDDEADVVNTAEIFPLRPHVRVLALLAGPDGQVQVPIAKVDVGAAIPANFYHPKHVFVKGRDLLQVVGRQAICLIFAMRSLLKMRPFWNVSQPDCTRRLRVAAV